MRTVIRAARDAGIDYPLASSTVHRLFHREGLFDSKPPDGADRRRFAFRDAGELWMSDVMHGPKVRHGRTRRKSYLKRAGTWNASSVLERATRVTPYAVVLVGALVSASGIYVKGVFVRRIAVLEDEAAQVMKNTPPAVRVRLATVVSDGRVIPGRTLLEITSENDIAYSASWHVSTREGRLVSGFMTERVKIVPAATPVYKAQISIQSGRVEEEYIELNFRYESVHSPELGNPPHLRGRITLPYRYSQGRVRLPTRPMLEYWNARHASQEPAS